MTFHERFEEFLKTRFSVAAGLSPLLISPHLVRLPRAVLKKVETAVSAFDRLAHSQAYQEALPVISPFKDFDPGNRAILMSFDCHLTPELEPKLIEINTNASFALIGDALCEFQKITGHRSFADQLKSAIEQELALSKIQGPPRIAIIDDKPAQQKLFSEFLFYQSLFRRFGWFAEVCDSAELVFNTSELKTPTGESVNFIYNRDTDFLLSRLPHVAQAYLEKKVCLSPNPHEYLLMADKSRLVEISAPGFLDRFNGFETLKEFVPATFDLKDPEVREQLWRERKKFFFKPKSAYGSKAVYRGRSISKKTFESVVTSSFVAQEAVPPLELAVTQPDGTDTVFKYDLRFYTYQSQVQLTLARLYRGQLTNFQEPGGGFAAVEWT